MERCLVLAARAYSFTDAAGKAVEGATLTYVGGTAEAEAGRRGLEPMTVTVSQGLVATLGSLPAVCDLEFRMRPGPKGRPQLSLVSATVLKPVDFSPLFQVGA